MDSACWKRKMRLFLRRARSASGQRPTVSPISPILWFDHFSRMFSRKDVCRSARPHNSSGHRNSGTSEVPMTLPPDAHVINEIIVLAIPFAWSVLLIGLALLLVLIALPDYRR